MPDERAQARNLGGTAKQPFALNEGGRLFLNPWELCRVPGSGHSPPGIQRIAQSIVQRAPNGLMKSSRSEGERARPVFILAVLRGREKILQREGCVMSVQRHRAPFA